MRAKEAFQIGSTGSIDAIKLVNGLAENVIHGKGRNAFNSANWSLIQKILAAIDVPTHAASGDIDQGFALDSSLWNIIFNQMRDEDGYGFVPGQRQLIRTLSVKPKNRNLWTIKSGNKLLSIWSGLTSSGFGLGSPQPLNKNYVQSFT